MRTKIMRVFAAFTVAEMTFLSPFGLAIAKAQGALPAEQHGPTADQLAQFEQQQGAPIDVFNQASVAPPSIPEPEKIPDDVKKLVPEKDLIAVYCATTKWKSGDFYLAMDALKKNLLPAIEQARSQGIDLSAPDIAGMTAEGTKRINAICAAKTIGDAEQLTADFAQWGREIAASSMTSIRSDMESKMKTAGDAIRAKVTDALQPLIASETAGIEADITAQAQQIAASLAASLAGSKTPPDPNAIRAQVEAQLQPIITEKTAQIEAKIKAKADEIVAPEKKRMESIGALFQGMDKKINDAIAAGAGQYAAQKKTALTLRRDLILKIFDANIAEATKQLDANATQIANAQKADPTVKSVADMKAELAKDRADLSAQLDKALAADDETAIATSMDAIRIKWETVQEQAQKSAAESVPKMCSAATTQFTSAKAQMQPSLTQIQALQSQCAQSTDAQCSKINALADKFSQLTSKMTDVMTEMDLATSLCQSATPDSATLLALFQKIQNDGAEAKAFGDALSAERTSAMASSVKAACDEALPQLQSARIQLQNNDLIVLKNKLTSCAGKTTTECTAVNAIAGKVSTFQGDVTTFLAQIDQATQLCKTASKDDASTEQVISLLSALKDQGDQIQAEGNDLKAEQAKNSSLATYCKAAKPGLASARTQIADGLQQMDAIFLPCANVKSATCDKLNTLATDRGNVNASAKSLLSRVTTADATCAQPSTTPAPANFVTSLQNIQDDADKLQQSVDALKAKADALKKGNGIWIEAENETSSYILPTSQRPAVNTKEMNPSWRPPYYGTGDWYLAAGGEWLSYTITAPSAGAYTLWVRDYVDTFQARGIRKIIVNVNGKNIGTFPETTVTAPGDHGAFGWHSIGAVTLTAGQNTLKVTKESTTRGAAILDAFYLTSGIDAPQEK